MKIKRYQYEYFTSSESVRDFLAGIDPDKIVEFITYKYSLGVIYKTEMEACDLCGEVIYKGKCKNDCQNIKEIK